MFKNFSIKQKIVAIPVIAGITFFTIVFILVLLNNFNKNISSKIQIHYYPLFELIQDLEDNFNRMQRSLQDAVATADSQEIQKADFMYDSLMSGINKASRLYKNEEIDFRNLFNELQDYYIIAKQVSHRMITEATDEDLVTDIEKMTVKYNFIKDLFQKNKTYYQESIAEEFELLHDSQNVTLLAIAIATVFVASIIGWISWILVRSITDRLQDVVNVANEVGSGNLNVIVSASSNDEVGVLKDAFRKMINKINILLKEKDTALKELTSEIKVRKKTEQELHKHKNNLEELVSERTYELQATNESLQKEVKVRKRAEAKQKQLLEEVESINQELKNFAYVVSHDLKAPLRAIGSLSDWLRTDYTDKFDDEGKELLRLLDMRVKRMHNLIEGILQYSRVGRIMEDRIKVDLNAVVKNVIDYISPPKNITINIEKKLPVVQYEKTRIEQVFQNLISNAVKYMDKPNGEINIGCSPQNGKYVIHVSDNGPGIEKKYFEKIFQIFQTLNSRDNFESTGVGLSLVKKIVEMYGGEIWLESEIGKGSTFKFSILKNIQK